MPIAHLNDRFRTRRACLIAAILVFAFAAALFIARAALRVGLDEIPGTGDAVDYDLLALELSAGHGYRFNFDNPAWRATYENAPHEGYENILARGGAAPTTYRPPLFPTMMAGLYAAFGRRFEIVRIVNCLLMAGSGGILAWIVGRRLGPIPALIFCISFALLEHRARYHAGLILTESSATFLVSLLVLLLIRAGRTAGWITPLTAGIVAGLAILDRPLLVLWMPVLAALLGWISETARWRAVALFLLAAMLVVSPWAIRNSWLLGRFAPLGTHGRQNLAAVYSDEAIAQNGVWFQLDETGFFPPELDDSRPGLSRELARARLSQRAAVDWIFDNPLGVVRLMAMRIGQLWQPRMHWDALILGLAIGGWLLWPDRNEWRIFSAVLLANTLAVAVTWSVAGRFLVPVLPILHALAACALWAAWGQVARPDRAWLTGQ